MCVSVVLQLQTWMAAQGGCQWPVWEGQAGSTGARCCCSLWPAHGVLCTCTCWQPAFRLALQRLLLLPCVFASRTQCSTSPASQLLLAACEREAEVDASLVLVKGFAASPWQPCDFLQSELEAALLEMGYAGYPSDDPADYFTTDRYRTHACMGCAVAAAASCGRGSAADAAPPCPALPP